MATAPSNALPRRAAIIDQGSNTLLLLALEWYPGCPPRVLAEEICYPRLGEQVRETGFLQPAAMERALADTRLLCERCRALGIEEIHALGTSALRIGRNRDEYVARLRQACGLTLQVISEEEEARLSFALAAHHLRPRPGHRCAVLDIGGSSTEVSISAVGDPRRADNILSLPLGAVTWTERHRLRSPLPPSEREAQLALLAQALASLPVYPEPLLALGTSGTYTTLAALKRGRPETAADPIRGMRLTLAGLSHLTERLSESSWEQILTLPGIDPRRADVITAGALIALALARRLSTASIKISAGGIRWGFFYDRLGSGR